jgi:hypothetical protein
MTDNPDLWAVLELPRGLALGMHAGDDPALMLRSTASEWAAQGGNRVRMELAHVKALAQGLVMPAGQDNGNRWQWVVNARPEVARMKVVGIQQAGLWYCEGEGTRSMDAHELMTRYETWERDFSWASLPQADLSGAVLSKAVLYHVNLSGANLKGANLDRADLIGANLTAANLREAILTGANLREANLGKADLARANLSGAYVTSEQLGKAASLKGAAMPDGTKHE